ncbi:structural protein [Tenacibaculum phage Gundel_1]|uniref:Structural protein n=1 Tax=Tenacibaculum phage Gundel_1 TaxID=2745672 RepID=A0A8E5E9U1_9CAUD|nr:structural protein [Tenacibaculum phage Gundel_1]QQV91510.1 structural protein [Tenacibaculum phage Gundel_1]
MGKQQTQPTYLSQEEYDKKLDTEISTLIDQDFGDEDIKLYGEDFKSRYAVKKKDEEVTSPDLQLDGEKDVTTSTSVGDQSIPTNGPTPEDIIQALRDTGYTDEQIKVQRESMQQEPLGTIKEPFKFEKEEQPLAERSGLPGFEGKVSAAEVDVDVSELQPQINFAQKEESLNAFKQLKDKGEISEEQYKNFEKIITDPTKKKIAEFEKLKEQYNPQRMIDLTNKFKESGVLSNQEIGSIDKEIDRKRRGDFTFLEKAKIALNFDSERNIKNININDRNSVVANAVRQKQADFMSGLDNDERLLFESYLVKRNEKLSESVKTAENFNDNIVKTALPSEVSKLRAYDAEMSKITSKPRNQLTQEDTQNYNELLTKRKQQEGVINSLGEQYEANRKTMLDNSDDLMQFNDELDLAKRDYSFYTNRVKAIDRGFQFLVENAVSFTGNTLVTIAKEVPRVRLAVGDEKLQKAQDIFNAWQINIAETKEKFEAGKGISKSFADVKGVKDFGTYVADLFTDQVPILATIYATGGAGLYTVAASSGGERTGQLLKEVKEGKKDYTQQEIIGNGLLYAGGEFIGERITLGIMNDYRRLLNTVNKSGAAKTSFREGFKNQIKGTIKGVSTANKEGLSEVYTEFFQLLADNAQLDEKRSSQFLESYVGGFVMGKGMHVAGTIPNMALGSYSKYANRQQVEKTTRQINEYQKVIAKGDLSDAIKLTYQKKITDLINKNENTINQSVDAIQNLDSSQLKEVTGINQQLIELQKALEKDNPKEVKDALGAEIKQLSDSKDKMLSSPQEQLEVLPDNGVALKEEASKILTKEKQDSGAKEFKISDTEIAFKAAELLNKQETEDAGIKVEKPKNDVSKSTMDFVEGLGVLKDVSAFVPKSIKVIVEDASAMIGETDNGNIFLETIYVPTKSRGQGKASKVLDSLTERADEQGKTIELVAAPMDATTDFNKLVKLYESKGFEKGPRFTEDTGNMIRKPKTDDAFSGIDIALAEAPTEVATEVVVPATPTPVKRTTEFKPEITVETKSNNYDVSIVNGELQIKAKLGEPKISTSERAKIVSEYINNTDFSKGPTASFEGKGSLSDTQQSQVIANESNNPLEIAQEIVRVQNASTERIQQLETTKDDAIANVLKSYALNKDAKKEVTDLGRYYTNKANKQKNPISIDKARELAQSELGAEVSFQEVLDFLENNPSIAQYNESLYESIPEIADLKNKFKELTGLEATDKILNKVVEKQGEVTEETTEETTEDTTDEVPFQLESKQTKIAGAELGGLVNRLKKTGLADDVRILSDAQAQKILSEIKSGEAVTQTPNGFIYNNIVYLNRAKVKIDTPIHEFGHLWSYYIKEINPDVYQKGLNLIENSEYHNDIKNNSLYDNLTEEQKLEEALAQAIGEKGVKILNEAKKSKFSTWFKNLFSKIAQGLGLRNISGKQLSEITLEKFTDLASAELLSGIEIVKGKAPKPTKSEIADVNQIDVIVSERQAIIKERQRLKELVNSKKTVTEAVKKELVKYINSQLDSQKLSQAGKSDVTRLLNTVRAAKTKTNLLRAFEQVNEVFTKLENKVLFKGINDILDKKLSKKESGRRKANLVTEEVETILRSVKENIKNIPKDVTVPAKRSTKNRINEYLVELFEKRDSILSKENQTDSDYIELESLVISIDILTGITAENSNTTNENFTESLGNLASIYENGRSQLKELRDQRKEQDQELIDDIINDVNPEGITTIKTEKEINAERKKITNGLNRLIFNAGSGWFTGNLDSIMSIISRRTGESPLTNLVSEMKSKETGKKRRTNLFSNRVNQAQVDLFGSLTKADIALNKINEVTVSRQAVGTDINTPKSQQELPFSNSQLLNLWMNNHNSKLQAGLEANGFDAKFFEKVNKVLPLKVKEYGESLFDIYDELHIEADQVYKEMNFHSMGKQDFYAGKVYRSDFETKPDELKIDSGNFSINSTGFGSQKERTANDKPIEASDVNTLVLRAIQETSHYVAFAEVHRKYAKILKDKGFKNAVNVTNKKNGDTILNILNFYKERDLERGGYRGSPILDALARNISRSTLALKTKIGVTQMVSFFNGGIDMPQLSAVEYVKYYNPVELVTTMRKLLKESDYLKNRYDVDGIENAMTGLSAIAAKSEFSLPNNTLEANRKAASRFVNKAFNYALANVKYGDMVGVTGAVPAYLAWKDKYKKQGLSEEAANQKALKRFEASVDKSQQTTSSFGKSPFQKHPVGRYFAMFATAPIQNIQNANLHWRELYRNLAKEGSGKGTNFQHIMGIMNYQFAQPMLYTYISGLMAGSIATALGFGDEEADDLDKSLLSSAILSNYGSAPIFGSIVTKIVDMSLGKEFTFGGLLSSVLFSTTDKLNDNFNKWMKAKTKSSAEKYKEKTLKQVATLFLSIPTMATDTYLDWDEIYWNDNVDQSVKVLKAMGYSDYLIEQSLTTRISKESSAKKKRKQEKKFKASIKKYEKKKTKVNPLFRVGGPKNKR